MKWRRKEKKVTEEGKRKALVGLKTTISVMTIIMKEVEDESSEEEI